MDERLAELLDSLENSQTLEECWGALVRFSQRLGFDCVIYGAMNIDHRDKAPLQLANVNSAWVPYYRDNELYKHDILVDHLLVSLKPFEYYTETLKDDELLTKEQRSVVSEAADAGIRNILAFPTRPSSDYTHGNFSYIHIGATEEARDAYRAFGSLLALAGMYTEIYLQRYLPSPEYKPSLTLSPRQHEILQKLCAGLGYKQIASELHLSERGVIYHVNCMRKQINAESARELIGFALLNNIITI